MTEKNVNPLYLSHSKLFKHRAVITKIGTSEINKKNYQWVQLNETIFHPKGGGQLSDEGSINGIKVVYVHKELLDKNRLDAFDILHCFDENQELNFKEGDEVELIVDQSKRELYSRMHTAGHVLAEVVKSLFPELEPTHGNHDPLNGYVRFKFSSELPYEKDEIKLKSQNELQSWLETNHPVSVIAPPSGIREIHFSKHVMACGGTHVENLKEIGNIEITDVSFNKKDQVLTVKYRLVD